MSDTNAGDCFLSVMAFEIVNKFSLFTKVCSVDDILPLKHYLHRWRSIWCVSCSAYTIVHIQHFDTNYAYVLKYNFYIYIYYCNAHSDNVCVCQIWIKGVWVNGVTQIHIRIKNEERKFNRLGIYFLLLLIVKIVENIYENLWLHTSGQNII